MKVSIFLCALLATGADAAALQDDEENRLVSLLSPVNKAAKKKNDRKKRMQCVKELAEAETVHDNSVKVAQMALQVTKELQDEIDACSCSFKPSGSSPLLMNLIAQPSEVHSTPTAAKHKTVKEALAAAETTLLQAGKKNKKNKANKTNKKNKGGSALPSLSACEGDLAEANSNHATAVETARASTAMTKQMETALSSCGCSFVPVASRTTSSGAGVALMPLAPPPSAPPDTDIICAGDVIFDFKNIVPANIYSNLGGQGPDFAKHKCLATDLSTCVGEATENHGPGACCLRYNDIGNAGVKGLDLVVEVTSGAYKAERPEKNGVDDSGSYGKINLKGSGFVQAWLRFSLVDSSTNALVTPPPAKWRWAFLDIDHGGKAKGADPSKPEIGVEGLRMPKGQFTKYYTNMKQQGNTNAKTQMKAKLDIGMDAQDQYLVVRGAQKNNIEAAEQSASSALAVGFSFEARSFFDVELSISGKEGKTGRNIFFNAQTLATDEEVQEHCIPSPPPSPPPPMPPHDPPPPPSPPPPAPPDFPELECAGSLKTDFSLVSNVYSNLGGQGPDLGQENVCVSTGTSACMQTGPDALTNGGCCLRYYGVGKLTSGDSVDLVVELAPGSNYYAEKIEKNGVEPTFKQYGQINFGNSNTAGNQNAELVFSVAMSGSMQLVPPLDILKFTFLDLDQGEKKGDVLGEMLSIDLTQVTEYYTGALIEGTTSTAIDDLETSVDSAGILTIKSEKKDVANPKHPLGLTDAMQKVAIGFMFTQKNQFSVRFQLFGSAQGLGGRNTFFTGASVQTERGKCLDLEKLELTDIDVVPADLGDTPLSGGVNAGLAPGQPPPPAPPSPPAPNPPNAPPFPPVAAGPFAIKIRDMIYVGTNPGGYTSNQTFFNAAYSKAAAGEPIHFPDGKCSSLGTLQVPASHPTCTNKGMTTDTTGWPLTAKMGFSASVSGSSNSNCLGGCYSCAAGALISEEFVLESASAGGQATFKVKAIAGGDWFEGIGALYDSSHLMAGAPIDEFAKILKDKSPVKTYVFRGQSMSSFKEMTIPSPGAATYFFAFFLGSYDATCGTWLGATLELGGLECEFCSSR
jgi:hypothetical protein